ncbi:MAG: HesA/MoeB/ThiF family protein [Arsenophonus sp.]|nr:MAG: HesA/MoeB/ThiF family protein [Arsenophonus sp.]
MLRDSLFIRYNQQILLKEIGIDGQKELLRKKILIIGLGGLGSPVSMYLAGSGIGELWLSDKDRVDLSNLQRQILYSEKDINHPKVFSASKYLKKLNHNIKILTFFREENIKSLEEIVEPVDLILDCTDNISSRYIINQVCIAKNKIFVTASSIGFNGQVTLFKPPYKQGCYFCLYPNYADINLNCQNSGILGPVAGIIGMIQALESLKVLLNIPSFLDKELLIFDAKKYSCKILKRKKNKKCVICGDKLIK